MIYYMMTDSKDRRGRPKKRKYSPGTGRGNVIKEPDETLNIVTSEPNENLNVKSLLCKEVSGDGFF